MRCNSDVSSPIVGYLSRAKKLGRPPPLNTPIPSSYVTSRDVNRTAVDRPNYILNVFRLPQTVADLIHDARRVTRLDRNGRCELTTAAWLVWRVTCLRLGERRSCDRRSCRRSVCSSSVNLRRLTRRHCAARHVGGTAHESACSPSTARRPDGTSYPADQ